MKPGWKTSEFFLAVKWSAMGAAAVAALLASLPQSWEAALIALPPVCLLVYLAGAQAHNYAENRFQLKARQMPAPEAGPAEPAKTMGFGRYVAAETELNEMGEE